VRAADVRAGKLRKVPLRLAIKIPADEGLLAENTDD
jgi:hypothetical protein